MTTPADRVALDAELAAELYPLGSPVVCAMTHGHAPWVDAWYGTLIGVTTTHFVLEQACWGRYYCATQSYDRDPRAHELLSRALLSRAQVEVLVEAQHLARCFLGEVPEPPRQPQTSAPGSGRVYHP